MGGGWGVRETEVSFRAHRAESGADTSFITPVSHFWTSKDISDRSTNIETLNWCDNKKSRDGYVDIIHSVSVCVCLRLGFLCIHIHMSVWAVSTAFCDRRQVYTLIIVRNHFFLSPSSLLCTLFTFARGTPHCQTTEVASNTWLTLASKKSTSALTSCKDIRLYHSRGYRMI